MLFLLKQSPIIRQIAKSILEEPVVLSNSLQKCEKSIQQIVNNKNNKNNKNNICQFCNECNQQESIKHLKKRMELRIREVEKKTDGLREFLSTV